jgi:hypothetical protein
MTYPQALLVKKLEQFYLRKSTAFRKCTHSKKEKARCICET